MSTVEARLVFDSYLDISLKTNEQIRRGIDDKHVLMAEPDQKCPKHIMYDALKSRSLKTPVTPATC